jgi:putative oxidoreductase
MGTIKTLNKWANKHTYYPLDILRIALGLFLFIKGLYFIGNTQIILELVSPLKGFAGSMLAVHYVAPAHLVGGLLIIFGLYTRWAILTQLPI